MSVQSTAELNPALHALKDVLTRQHQRGAETVALLPESLDRLTELPMALMKLSAGAEKAPARIAEPEPETEAPVIADVAIALDEAPQQSARPVNHDLQGRGIEVLQPEGETKRDKLNNIFRMAKACERCRGLGSLRDQIVFATGNPDADLMFVGEAPGAEEEKQRKPFIGPAGQKLTSIIQAMGLSREDVYISNIVKFRPMIGDGRFQGPKNRKPMPEEMSASVKYVMAEIDVVQPKVIVALGGTAAEGLLDLSGSVSRMRNQFYDLRGVPVMVSYHPSYLLRSESDADGGRPKKRMVWEDMLLVMEKAGLSISDKQRAYFTT